MELEEIGEEVHASPVLGRVQCHDVPAWVEHLQIIGFAAASTTTAITTTVSATVSAATAAAHMTAAAAAAGNPSCILRTVARGGG